MPHDAAIRSCSRLSTARASAMTSAGTGEASRDQPPQRLAQGAQLGRVDPAAGRRDGLAFQDAADLADLADLVRRDPPDDRPAVGQQVDDADPRQRDQRLADRRVADPEPIGQLLRDQVLARPEPALDDVLQQRLHDRLPAQAMVTLQRGQPASGPTRRSPPWGWNGWRDDGLNDDRAGTERAATGAAERHQCGENRRANGRVDSMLSSRT